MLCFALCLHYFQSLFWLIIYQLSVQCIFVSLTIGTLEMARSYFISFLHFRVAMECHGPPDNKAPRPFSTWIRQICALPFFFPISFNFFIFQTAKTSTFHEKCSSFKVVYGIIYNIPVSLNVPKSSFIWSLLLLAFPGTLQWSKRPTFSDSQLLCQVSHSLSCPSSCARKFHERAPVLFLLSLPFCSWSSTLLLNFLSFSLLQNHPLFKDPYSNSRQ